MNLMTTDKLHFGPNAWHSSFFNTWVFIQNLRFYFLLCFPMPLHCQADSFLPWKTPITSSLLPAIASRWIMTFSALLQISINFLRSRDHSCNRHFLAPSSCMPSSMQSCNNESLKHLQKLQVLFMFFSFFRWVSRFLPLACCLLLNLNRS